MCVVLSQKINIDIRKVTNKRHIDTQMLLKGETVAFSSHCLSLMFRLLNVFCFILFFRRCCCCEKFLRIIHWILLFGQFFPQYFCLKIRLIKFVSNVERVFVFIHICEKYYVIRILYNVALQSKSRMPLFVQRNSRMSIKQRNKDDNMKFPHLKFQCLEMVFPVPFHLSIKSR